MSLAFPCMISWTTFLSRSRWYVCHGSALARHGESLHDITTLGKLYKTVANDAVPLEDGNGALGMVVVVVINEIGIGHAIFLLDVYSGLDHLSEACRVRVTCLECSGHHVGEGGRSGSSESMRAIDVNQYAATCAFDTLNS